MPIRSWGGRWFRRPLPLLTIAAFFLVSMFYVFEWPSDNIFKSSIQKAATLQPEDDYVLEVEQLIPLPELIPEYPKQGFAVVRKGVLYDAYATPTTRELVKDTVVRPIASYANISDMCLEHWTAKDSWDGPCSSVTVREAVIDLVWTWVNGSDVLHHSERNRFLNETGHQPTSARFRENDELRYSLRSALRATGEWMNSTWHIITADVRDPEHNGRRLGLLPQWIDTLTSTERHNNRPAIVFLHDSQLFRYHSFEPYSDVDIEAWHARVLPTFNSHAIEVQLSNLDPGSTSENLVVLNDDHYLVLEMPPSAFSSALYGPVFRFDTTQQINGENAGLARGEHEALSLRWACHVLDDRFGTRSRAYVAHNARSFSLPLMHEASLAFADNFMYTALSRFRGMHRKPRQYEINTIFLSTHFVIERHREALLWSWIVAKWGGADGILTISKKDLMWAEMGGDVNEDKIRVKAPPSTTTGERVTDNMDLAGLEPPESSDPTKRTHTVYKWTSHDGYPVNFDGIGVPRTISRRLCLGDRQERAWDLFKRLLKENVRCGDAVLSSLKTTTAELGLAIFLPPESDMPILLPLEVAYILPLRLHEDPPPLPPNPRAFAIRLFQRYSYVIGDSPARFIMMTTPWDARKNLKIVESHKDIAFLCINDDMPDNDKVQEEVVRIHKEFLRRRFPDTLDCLRHIFWHESILKLQTDSTQYNHSRHPRMQHNTLNTYAAFVFSKGVRQV